MEDYPKVIARSWSLFLRLVGIDLLCVIHVTACWSITYDSYEGTKTTGRTPCIRKCDICLSPPDTKVTSDNPFLAFRYLSSFVLFLLISNCPRQFDVVRDYLPPYSHSRAYEAVTFLSPTQPRSPFRHWTSLEGSGPGRTQSGRLGNPLWTRSSRGGVSRSF
jgi:hypothetical protein